MNKLPRNQTRSRPIPFPIPIERTKNSHCKNADIIQTNICYYREKYNYQTTNFTRKAEQFQKQKPNTPTQGSLKYFIAQYANFPNCS